MEEKNKEKILEIKDMIKIFYPGTVNETTAINGLNLNVYKRDVISIIGSNGSGKSTLFNLISGTFLPTSGTISTILLDFWSDKSEYKRSYDIGRVFQDPTKGTSPNMSIEDNLNISSKKGFRGLNVSLAKKGVRAKYEEMISKIGLAGRLKDNVGLLSGGQRQALTLLMTVQSNPKILLLDEHTAALDPKAADKIMIMTENIIKHYNLTCLMITHNMQFAIEFGNRLIMMDRGKIVLDLKEEEKRNLTVPKLIELFKKKTSSVFDDDEALLTK